MFNSTVMVERMYARLPDALRARDAQNAYALKRYLSAVGDVQDAVDQLLARFEYLAEDDRPMPWEEPLPYKSGFYDSEGNYYNEDGVLIPAWRNLATNPSFETGYNLVEARRNFFPNPVNQGTITNGLALGWSAYATGGAVGTYSVQSGWQNLLPTSIPVGARFGIRRTIPFAAAAGETYAFRLSNLALPPAGLRWRVHIDITKAGGGLQTVSIVTPATGLSVTLEADTTSISYHLWLETTGTTDWTGTASVGFSWFMIEKGAVVGDAFSGNTQQSPDPDLTHSWIGAPADSPSILVGARVAGAVYGGVSYQSGHWASSGTKSVLFRSTRATVGEAIVFLFGTWGQMSGMSAGKTYTIMAKVRMTGPITDSTPSRRLALRGAGTTTQSSAQWPNQAGVYDVRFTATLGASATEAIVQLQHQGIASDPPIWVDDFMIVEGEYTGPYFDGTNPPALAKNLASDPRATGNGNGAGLARWGARWFGGGGNGTTSAITSASDGPEVAPGVKITSYLRKTWTVAGGVGDTGFDHTIGTVSGVPAALGSLPVTPGQTYTFSSYLRASRRDGSATFAMRVVFRNSAGERILPSPAIQHFLPVAGQWVRVSYTVVAPANAAAVSLASDVMGAGIWAPGDTLDGTGLLVQESATLNDYIDGNMPDAMWLGAENNSISITYDTSYHLPVWEGTPNESTSFIRPTGIPANPSVLPTRPENKPVGSTSDLIDAATADAAWLPWIAQLFGVDSSLFTTESELRSAISTGVGGYRAGSTGALKAAVQSELTGGKLVNIYPSTTATSNIGAATAWDVLIVSRVGETPPGADLVGAAIRNRAKPAGVVLHHKTFEATWDAVEQARPTWDDWEGKTWFQIEESGL